jgi:formylglycine-generating enzyme required for sulfatase activity
MFAITVVLTNPTWAQENPDEMVLVPGGSFLMGIDKKVNVDTKKNVSTAKD